LKALAIAENQPSYFVYNTPESLHLLIKWQERIIYLFIEINLGKLNEDTK